MRIEQIITNNLRWNKVLKSERIILFAGVLFCLMTGTQSSGQSRSGPYQATGIKIGEISQTEAIIWTRLTLNQKRVGSDAPQPKILYKDSETGIARSLKSGGEDSESRPDLEPVVTYPEGYNINNIDGAVPGTSGKVRLLYRSKKSSDWKIVNWEDVATDHDFTYQFRLGNLEPDTEYMIKVESSSPDGNKGETVEGKFRTAPPPEVASKVVFTVVTGQNYRTRDDGESGYKIYSQMLKLNPDFFVHTGDIVYYDQLA
ncbi:MAG: hypothetical protein C0408_11095, partial [Odoribacter sp.]|nr:hypothetical protein [Odoribacter sp.]